MLPLRCYLYSRCSYTPAHTARAKWLGGLRKTKWEHTKFRGEKDKGGKGGTREKEIRGRLDQNTLCHVKIPIKMYILFHKKSFLMLKHQFLCCSCLLFFFVFLKINTCLLTKKEQSPSDMPTNQSDLDNFLMSLLSQVILDCVKLTIKAILKGIHSFLVLSIEAFGTFFILIALRTSHLQNDSRGKTT